MKILIMENLKLAWRNLWRNKRRTLITVTSIFAAVFFTIMMRSLQLGAYGHMYKNAIETYSGYIQIQHKDFWDDKTVDNVFEYNDELNSYALSNANVDATIKRFESFALASNGPQTKGIMVMGIDPEKERLLSNVKNRVIKYKLTEEAIAKLNQEDISEKTKANLEIFKEEYYANSARVQLDLGIKDQDIDGFIKLLDKHATYENYYIKSGEPGVLIGLKLAEYLKLNIGDTLILFGQGYHGFTAAGKYPVKGFVKLPTVEMEGNIAYLPIDICQELYSAPNMLTALVLNLKATDDKDVSTTVSQLEENIPEGIRAIDWLEMNKMMVQQMEADDKGGMIMIAILYMVIAFGVFGTVLMMTAERRREFGVLIAIGMQKTKLSAVMTLEMTLMGIVGIASGIIASIPLILLGYYRPLRFSGEIGKMFEEYGMEPIMPFKWFDTYILWQVIIVLVIILIAMVHPLRKIHKLKVINALRA